MKILKEALCGTLLSNDCLVSIEPGDGKITLFIESIVKDAFGEQIGGDGRNVMSIENR